jgi:hypothetical protein
MATDYTGNPTATQAPASAPGPGVAPIVRIPADGDASNAASITQEIKALADYVAWLTKYSGGGVYGDGSDGTASVDGANTFSWASKSGADYTLIRDVFLDSLTVTGASTTLKTNGYRIWVRNTLTTSGGGKIWMIGNAASGATAGAALTTGTIRGAGAGGAGSSGTTNGSAGQAVTGLNAGGDGGIGGLGASSIAGTTGTYSLGRIDASVGYGNPRIYAPSTFGAVASANDGITWLYGGAGGGGGGGGGVGQAGGGGGSGGGVICIAARNIVLSNANTITAQGGAGANGVGTNAGGGGGGGGGCVILVYSTLTASAGTMNAATCCNGGNAGAGTGTGNPGSPGSVGLLYLCQTY